VLPESGVPPLSGCSPRATLARYVGFKHDLGAPYWTKWDKSVSFRQPRCLFADTFARMANWEENRAVVRIPQNPKKHRIILYVERAVVQND